MIMRRSTLNVKKRIVMTCLGLLLNFLFLIFQSLKSAVRSACQLRQSLKEGRAFEFKSLKSFLRPPAHFSAMDHDQGFIAAVSVDNYEANQSPNKVVIVSPKTGQSVQEMALRRDLSRACSIRLLFPFFVCVGFLQGRVLVIKLPSEEEIEISAHAAPVFSIDANLDLNMLATGSADHTVRLWQLDSGFPIKTLTSQASWTVRVLLRSCDNLHSLYSMSKDFIHVFEWTKSDDIPKLDAPRLVIPLKSELCFHELRDAFFTPGLHVQGDKVTFVRQMPLFETQTIGDADIFTVDRTTGKTSSSVHVNQKIRKLLAIGNRFALVLLPYVDTKFKNLIVIDLLEGKTVGGATVPHSRAPTPDCGQICVGDLDWLDGLGETADKQFVAGVVLQDGAICICSWRK